MALVRVAAAADDPGGAGFPRHPIARHPRLGRRAAGPSDAFQQAEHSVGKLGIQHPFAPRRRLQLEGRQRQPDAAIGDGQIGLRQLQRRKGQPVAIGQGGSGDRILEAGIVQMAHGFAGQAAADEIPGAGLPQNFVNGPGFQAQGHFGDAHLAGFLQCLGQSELAVVDWVFHQLPLYLVVARRSVDQAVRAVLPGLQGGHDGERLDRGSRLVQVRHRPVAHAAIAHLQRLVGVVGGLIDQGQHLAGAGIQHHQRAGDRLPAGHRPFQFPEGVILQAQIQAECQILAHARRRDEFQIPHLVAQPILQHDLAPMPPAQQAVEGQFGAFQAHIVDIGDAHHMRGGFRGRVVAAVFIVEMQALDAQFADALRRAPGHPPLQIDEGLAKIRLNERIELVGVRLQKRGQPLQIRAGHAPRAGIRPERGHRGAHRQGFAEAVLNHAPMGGNDLGADRPGVSLILQEVLFKKGQIAHAGGQGNASGEQEEQQAVVAPDFHGSSGSTWAGKRMSSSVCAARCTFW